MSVQKLWHAFALNGVREFVRRMNILHWTVEIEKNNRFFSYNRYGAINSVEFLL